MKKIIPILILWIIITSSICQIKNTNLNEFQVFFRITKSFILDFEE